MVKDESSPSRKNCLEWYMKYFIKYCNLCNQRMIVHACRFKEAVYAHCINCECENKSIEIRYLEPLVLIKNEAVGPKRRMDYEEKRKMIKEIMRAPRIRIVPARIPARNAHMGMGA